MGCLEYSQTPVYGHLTKPVTPPLLSPWLSPKLFPIVKNMTLVPVIRSPPYSGIRSVIPSQVAELPRYNGQSRPSSGSWLQIQLPSCRRRADGRSARTQKRWYQKETKHLLASYKDCFTSATMKQIRVQSSYLRFMSTQKNAASTDRQNDGRTMTDFIIAKNTSACNKQKRRRTP